jgi:hypothetical protein
MVRELVNRALEDGQTVVMIPREWKCDDSYYWSKCSSLRGFYVTEKEDRSVWIYMAKREQPRVDWLTWICSYWDAWRWNAPDYEW